MQKDVPGLIYDIFRDEQGGDGGQEDLEQMKRRNVFTCDPSKVYF
jgi:hypothetical protein